MSEDVGVKAPVTRLRRRLSVESEEVKSPAGTNTPTKKKGGRLATKPQLDLIEEIDAEQIPKRSTRKTAVKDIVEPVEEKPVTPSRRSARIRSNTSILSETPLALDSPRAKRAAARRTSQAGSDNDAPLTPARQTRRTRKDSTSSIDIQVDKASNKTSAATEVIVEEKESNNDDSNSKEMSLSKSPKLKGKRGKKNSISISYNDIEDNLEIKNDKDFNSTNKENQEIHEKSSEFMSKTSSADNREKKDTIKDSNSKVDTSDILLTENLDAKPKNNSSILHKSTSAIEDSKSFKSKRHRTKSVSAITTINSNDCTFFSDTEISKNKRKEKSLTPGSNDICLSDSQISKKKTDKSLKPLHSTNKDDTVQNTVDSSKKNKHDKEVKLSNTSKNTSISEESMIINESFNNSVPKTGWKKNIINQIQTENIDSKDNNDYISPIKCFENAPSKDIQSVVFIEDDSDSNVCNNDNVCPAPHVDSEDQCVPVVKHDNQNNSNEKIPHDNSYEPMDIDESIQQNTSINISMENNPKTLNQQEIKKESFATINLSSDCNNINSNKSKRKSSLPSFESHNEKSSCESKSTLLLSQIKDTSSNEINEKSPKVNNRDQLSKSINILDKIKTKIAEKRKLSLDYSTSTPLQQKSMKKLGVPIDTSLISPKIGNKAKSSKNREKSKEYLENSKNPINIESDDDSDASDELESEITKTQNEIIDDEAEEASEDYQSGDSQDEDDKQYEEEHEIVEKGETLDTEEEFSDDTDYEKDSFVVSSDEVDNELLSGSGDDLSMSDNELSMSAKSKKKYNEKKVKEQKKASREMYEARHKLDKKMQSSKSRKNNRQCLSSSSSDSGEEITVQPKKNNRQRIDSSQDLSQVKSDNDESVIKKNKQKPLSESEYGDNIFNEQEITVCNESKVEDQDPISVAIKNEPITPKKNNLSAVLINENIEEINIDQNASIMKPNETSDPLFQAIAVESGEDSSSSEENNEIMKSYNSILENLNNHPKDIIHDISLNANKKQKKNKEPIVDQLNLTQTKVKKNKNKSVVIDGVSSSEKDNKTPIDKEDDDVSDSIDMRLLFTEDSNDSESVNIDKTKEVSVANISDDKEYIPLKKTEAKTNLLEVMGTAIEVSDSSHLNEIKKKNKKRISSQNIPQENIPSNELDNNEGSFFIDTTGTRLDMDEPVNTTFSNNNKKKKNRNSECDSDVEEVKDLLVYNDETEVKKTPKKTHNTENQINKEIITEEAADVSTITTPHSGKKKKKGKKSLNTTEVDENEIQNNIAQDVQTVTAKTPVSGKKKNKSILSLDEAENIHNIQEEAADVSTITTPHSGKKKKKGKKSLNTTEVDENEIQNEIAQDVPTVTAKTPVSGKKKNKSILSLDEDENIHNIQDTEEMQQEKSFEVKVSSDKKKKKAKKSLTDIQNESQVNDTSDVPTDVKHQSDKKRTSSHLNVDIIPLALNKSDDEEPPLEVSYRSDKKDKSGLESQLTDNLVVTETSLNTSKNSGKKRKRKHSATTGENIPLENVKENYKDEQHNASLPGNQKKKRKLNSTEESSTQDIESTEDSKGLSSVETCGSTKLKKNKHVTKQENIPIIHKEDTEKYNNKKRKERDDDDTTHVSKMFKHESFNKAQVTRLPSYILNQLGDKPNKTVLEAKKAKLIATTNFTVEDTKVRRNKPSNYLEESVYLNDDNIIEKHKKYSIKKPKVLPFIPTASTSDSGFTTNFRINLLPRETQFVAQATDVINFKKDFLQQQKIKKFHTFEKYKNQRNVKLSKF